MGVGIVAHQLKILEAIVVYAVGTTQDVQLRQRPWRPGQLLAHLLQVIAVYMGVTRTNDDFPGLQVTLLSQHHGQRRKTGGVIGQAEKRVAGADQ